jgi:DNA-binding NtrC family response regulator
MRELVATVEKLVDRDITVLIRGESGSGKNFLAEVIHASGPRRSAPFVHIDCASIPHDLFESELFGYEKGTFTDATSRKIGKLEAAQNGTVYFDEIAALTPPLQAKLLRAVEERRFTRLGGSQTVAFAAHLISSTSSDLDALVATGAFRRDLLYRVNVMTLHLPALRERREDIPPLATAFLRASGRKSVRGFDPEAMAMLKSYSWPGNVRELRNVIERAVLLEDTPYITPASLPADRFRDAGSILAAAAEEHLTLEELERRYISVVLRRTGYNSSKAAEILCINRKTLREKRKRYGLE